MIRFDDPIWLWALLALPVLGGLHWWRSRKGSEGAITYAAVDAVAAVAGWRQHLAGRILATLPYLALALGIVAMARPVELDSSISRSTEGIDIVLTMDISTSMLAEDLRPNRFNAAKAVAAEFIDARVSDRVGLVVFARQSFTLMPPTLDYRLLKKSLADLKMGQVEDGTAIGLGIATAVNRLRNSTALSKVVILLTDGENNAGEIDPLTAADLAREFGIRVYTIGASTEGTAPYPVNDPIFGPRYHPLPVNIDEPLLKEVAERTGGRYFRARDTQGLRSIYREIDQLERSEVEELLYVDKVDRYAWFLAPSVFLMLIWAAADRWYHRFERA